jgi:hypothetical protein
MQQQGCENQRKRKRETQRLSRQAKSVELAELEQLVDDQVELTAEQQARLVALQSAKKRNSETTLLIYHAKRQKREDAACVESQLPFSFRELDNNNACTLCNALFSSPNYMKTHTSKFILCSHFIH